MQATVTPTWMVRSFSRCDRSVNWEGVNPAAGWAGDHSPRMELETGTQQPWQREADYFCQGTWNGGEIELSGRRATVQCGVLSGIDIQVKP